MIVDGETGFLFESGSVDQLAEKMQEVTDLADTRLIEMGKFAREYVEKTYSKEQYVDKTVALYQSLGVTPPSAASA